MRQNDVSDQVGNRVEASVLETGSVPDPGQLVRVRGRHWVVADISRANLPSDALGDRLGPEHLVTLTSVEDDRYDESIRVIWELEAGRWILDKATLPTPDLARLDDPARLAAFLDAVRWGAITSADSTALQAPFRAGISIEDYQLDPVVRALSMPRVNLLIADDVGMGKTIEAGLVLEELLLRHRARTCLVICPANLCVKWRDEMAEKFGLEFRIVNAELLRELRRSRGLRANPWTHFPRLIVSIDWLKRDRPMKLFGETVNGSPAYPRTFDLLIIDEVHNVAPSGRGKYATDSQRTEAVRAVAPHFEHRLFLSATPHNGYRESWTALLELLDSQRFARNVEPDPRQLQSIMVRRLKSELPPLADGTERFPKRIIEAIAVEYPLEEREAHRLLEEYAESRRKDADDEASRTALDFTLKLLKKRLFSSPVAFGNTLAVHTETATNPMRKRDKSPTLRVLTAAVARTEDEVSDEEERAELVREALTTSAEFTEPISADQKKLLAEMRAWAERNRGRADSKAQALLDWVNDQVRPTGTDGERRWNDERIIIFTEYRDTQKWLFDLLDSHGLGGDRLAQLYGGMDEDDREHVKAVFQAHPSLDPVRVLLATDTASEGIDLQLHCHRLVHYEIPWNPNRLEQRNGRIDRHGQTKQPLVYHFVGAGYEGASGDNFADDLEFLAIVARKVDTIREDLGSAGPVIAAQVEERMLGKRKALDEFAIDVSAPRGRLVGIERDIRQRIERLREQLDQSIAELHVAPSNVERVVSTALKLADQPALDEISLARPGGTSPRVFLLPRLTGSWARAREGLLHPVTGRERPVTFDNQVAAAHDDVVLAHLGHRLVQQATWLLRAEIWSSEGNANLSRVTARIVSDDAADELIALAHARLVITGAAGHRLHEEVIVAGGRVRNGRFARITAVGDATKLADTPTLGIPPIAAVQPFVDAWDTVSEGLLTSLNRREQDRAESLATKLSARADEDATAIRTVLEELRRSIKAELDDFDGGFRQLELFGDERTQYDRDVDALRHRLDQIPAEIETESAAVRRRYSEPTPRLFPAAVEFLVPERFVKAR
jgi:SNF2 family DNA or RNA helicase